MTDPLGLIGSGGAAMNPIARRTAGAAGGDSPGFKELLLKNIEQVNGLQREADLAIEDLALGRRDDVAGVMIAKQKADLAFKMLLQVRNKLMDAYDEVKQLRV